MNIKMNKFTNFIQKFEKKLLSKFQSEFKFEIDPFNGGTIYFDKTMFKISMYKQVIGDRCEIQILCSHFVILFSKYITKARKSEAPYNHLISSTQLSVTVCHNQTTEQLFLENQVEIVLSQLIFYFNKMNGLDYYSYNNIFNSNWDKVVNWESDDNIYACFQDQKFDFHVFYRKLFMSAMVGSLDYENILKLPVAQLKKAINKEKYVVHITVIQ